MEHQTFTKTFRTSEGKNGKTNYSRNYPTQETQWVRSSKVDFDDFQNKCCKHEISYDGRFTIHTFTYNK